MAEGFETVAVGGIEQGDLRMQLPSDTVLAVIVRRDPQGYLLARYAASPLADYEAFPHSTVLTPILVSRAGNTLRGAVLRALVWLVRRL